MGRVVVSRAAARKMRRVGDLLREPLLAFLDVLVQKESHVPNDER